MKLKDSENLILQIGNMRLQACDVDANGFVENVDLLVNDALVICCNIQTNQEYGSLVRALFQAHHIGEWI